MVKFRKKNIVTVKSLGEDLERARKNLGLSLVAIEKRIGIGKKYLEALENNDWDMIPGEVYAKNWLKKYASFLGLSVEEIEEKFRRDKKDNQVWNEIPQNKFGVSKKRLIVLPRVIKRFILVLIVLVIISYLGSQVWSLVSPPKLNIIYPDDNFTVSNKFVKIVGQVEKSAWLGLNDKQITVDKYGWFNVDIDLNTGLNVIKIEAKKSYGRSSIKYIRIIAEE